MSLQMYFKVQKLNNEDCCKISLIPIVFDRRYGNRVRRLLPKSLAVLSIRQNGVEIFVFAFFAISLLEPPRRSL